MMTPRGVADVHVYTPERVEARYGIRPDQVPGLHRPQGRHERQHPRRPRHRRQDRRAADRAVRLARGGDRARRRAVAGAREEHHRARRPGARRRSSSRRCAATSTSTATRPQLVLAPPDRSQLKEIFRRFEFRNLLAPRRRARRRRCPAAPMAVTGVEVPWREGELDARAAASATRPTATAPRSRPATASSSAPRPARVDGRARRPRREGARASTRADDTLLAAYLIEPGRAVVRARRPRRRVRRRARCPTPAADEETARARPRRRDRRAGSSTRCSRGSRSAARPRSTATVELPLTRRARRDGARRRQDRHVPHGRDHRAARRARRRARGSARTSSRARSSCSARPSRSRGSCSRSSG